MAKVTNVITKSTFKYRYLKCFILRCWCACLSLLRSVNISYNILLSIIITLVLFPEVKHFFSIIQSYHWTLGNLEQLIQKWLIMKQMAPILSTGEGSFVSLGIWRRGSAHRWESREPKWTTSTAALYSFPYSSVGLFVYHPYPSDGVQHRGLADTYPWSSSNLGFKSIYLCETITIMLMIKLRKMIWLKHRPWVGNSYKIL
jgi:hypothetical protein